MAKKTIRDNAIDNVIDEAINGYFGYEWSVHVDKSGTINFCDVNVSPEGSQYVCDIGGWDLEQTEEWYSWHEECSKEEETLHRQFNSGEIDEDELKTELSRINYDPTIKDLDIDQNILRKAVEDDIHEAFDDIPFGFFDDEDILEESKKQIQQKYKGAKLWFKEVIEERDIYDDLKQISNEIWITRDGILLLVIIQLNDFQLQIKELNDTMMMKRLNANSLIIDFKPPYKISPEYAGSIALLKNLKKEMKKSSKEK